VNLDSVRLEVGSLKLVYDFSFTDSAEAILAALLSLLSDHAPSTSSASVSARKKLAVSLRRWLPLFDVYLASPTRGQDEVELVYRVTELVAAESVWRSAHSWSALLLAMSDAGIVAKVALTTWCDEVLGDEEEEASRAIAEEVVRLLDASSSNNRALKEKKGVKNAESSSEEDGDLVDDTTDGWFSAEKANPGNAWWDDDGDAGEEDSTKTNTSEKLKEKGDENDNEEEATTSPSASSFWAADDSFSASDSD